MGCTESLMKNFDNEMISQLHISGQCQLILTNYLTNFDQDFDKGDILAEGGLLSTKLAGVFCLPP